MKKIIFSLLLAVLVPFLVSGQMDYAHTRKHFAPIDTCRKSSCFNFNNTDLYQIYDAVKIKFPKSSLIDSCRPATCFQFGNTDLYQIYSAIKGIQLIATSGYATDTTKIPLAGTTNGRPQTGTIEYRGAVATTALVDTTNTMYIGAGNRKSLSSATTFGRIAFLVSGGVQNIATGTAGTSQLNLLPNSWTGSATNTLSTTSQIALTGQTGQVASTYTAFAGLTYSVDYSSNYTNRSLIDKGYAAATFAPISTVITGTTNYIPKFTGTHAIGNSIMYDNNSNWIAITGISSTGDLCAFDGNNFRLFTEGTGTSGKYFSVAAHRDASGGGNDWPLVLKATNAASGGAYPTLSLQAEGGKVIIGETNTATLQYKDGNQASGKVLTSDANGVGTWTTPSSTAVYATSPLSITTNTISIPAAATAQNGYLTSADWNTFNNKGGGNGTVTSVAALTLGTTGTDLSSSIANGTTTPVITLNVPDASASARGVITTGIQTLAGAKTFSTAPVLSSLTASQLLALDGSKNIQSLDVTTYPSLTELSYIKGVTSAIQTQLNSIQTQLNSKSNLIPIFSGKPRSMPYTGVVGNAAITGTIYYYPYYVGSTHTVTAISCEVTTFSVGTTVNMALYSDDGTGKPGSLVEASGTISSATTGVKTYTFSTPKVLSASNQVYWLAIQLTNGPSLRGTSNPVAFMYNTTGQSYQQTQAYGSFPSTAASLTVGTFTYLLTLTPQ